MSKNMLLDYVGGRRGLAKDDGWYWEWGYVICPIDYYILGTYLVCIYYGCILNFKKITSSFKEGGVIQMMILAYIEGVV